MRGGILGERQMQSKPQIKILTLKQPTSSSEAWCPLVASISRINHVVLMLLSAIHWVAMVSVASERETGCCRYNNKLSRGILVMRDTD